MKLISFFQLHFRSLLKLYVFVLFLFLLQVILSYVFVYKTSLTQVENKLISLCSRIEKDLQFDGNAWDTSRYNSDPLTPYPNGSSGFLNPLYIITKQGFIIERSTPIRGLLDTSDYNHLSQFNTPQTINTVTNEKWRILSQQIEYVGEKIGVIVVSYYNPGEKDNTLIDKKLHENITLIQSQLIVSKNKINTSQIDIRNIHYEFSFEVVDIYNNVLINNGRVPTFIDTSYFAREVDAPSYRIIRDTKSGEQFMIMSKIIKGPKQDAQGLIIAGESVKSLYLISKNYVIFAVLLSVLCIVPLLVYVIHILRIDLMKILSNKTEEKNSILPITYASFDKKKSIIQLNNLHFDIPYASNQFSICDAIFSAPTKRWEYDELLEKMGDSNTDEVNIRKVYDAVLAINKKCGVKIIEYKNRIFIFNPIYLHALSKK